MNTCVSTALKNVCSKVFRGVMILLLGVSSWALPALADNMAKKPSAKQVLAVSIDNDTFVPLGSRDRDFTGGMALTYSEAGGTENWRPIDALLGRFDHAVAAGAITQPAGITSMEFGFYGFTPDAIEQTDTVANDRPYASLIYFSTSRMYPLANGDSVSTALTFGVLGSNFVGAVQTGENRGLVSVGLSNQRDRSIASRLINRPNSAARSWRRLCGSRLVSRQRVA